MAHSTWPVARSMWHVLRGRLYHRVVQLDLPFLRAPGPGDTLRADPRAAPSIDYVRVRRARRYIVRVRPDGTVRVTIPRGGSRSEALRFVQKHLSWIHGERRRVRTAHAPRIWTEGTTLMLYGEPVVLHLVGSGDECRAVYGGRRVRVPDSARDLRPFVEADLRALARQELVARVFALAAHHGFSVSRVTIRDQRSRWGSCSPNGRIALNFRLVQMPPAICDYVLLHELMHLEQQNHSVRFWRLVERACPEFRTAERWLKTEGRSLF